MYQYRQLLLPGKQRICRMSFIKNILNTLCIIRILFLFLLSVVLNSFLFQEGRFPDRLHFFLYYFGWIFHLFSYGLRVIWIFFSFWLVLSIVTRNCLKSQNGTLFSHVWRRGRLALDPLQNKSCSEFFSQADKNWHITWGNNLGPAWPPLARGSKIHTITHPPGRFLLSPR